MTADAPLVMAYGPWHRWVRALRARGGRRRALSDGADPHERAYLVYGLVLVVLMYAPILWAALARAAAPLAGGGSVGGTLVATGAVVLGAAALAGVLLHRFGVPLWVAPTDAAYALAGVWDPRVVLWRRVLVLVTVTAVVAGLVGAAVASGVVGTEVGLEVGAVLAWGACAAGAAMLPLALAVAAQCPSWRTAARAVAVLIAAIGALVAVQGPGLVVRDACPVAAAPPSCGAAALLGPPPGVVGWAVALAVVAVPVLVAVLPRHLDVDAAAAAGQRVAMAGAGLQGGDAAGVRAVLGPARAGRRTAGFPARVLALSPSWLVTCWG
ncbi:hypothetical protein ACNHYB_06405 [Isoptericola jiangsuensis]|uniref:hypothetical protein n=1 Tax=Isoptericola jiangsuensis TaxID=548579 RepID=UPI003AB022DC